MMDFEGSRAKPKNRWTQKCAVALIKLLGWKINNAVDPTVWKKAVVSLAPHTSNWDFIYGILFKLSHPDVPLRFAIKKEVMFFPLSYLMKMLGAIPIDRTQTTKRTNMVAVMAEMLHQADALMLVIAPEGTRSYAKRWKTGFYRLAEAANVPIILGYINYAKKELGLGPIFHRTGNMEQDIASIQDFYRKIPGKYPDNGVIG
ncbi:MAG: 1-acyl-sn-glycerol-3-phosphate acyltransferase [Candidatus Cardinium sp.]|uniref:1-acyl-sn-glycerol-3-phosphate acyltransferase n=1 Tax=Candidatus Cardinium sp. TP TaxID=2961955 RepID=UPI0021AFD536|nr:1-acyl-sn-glycerol-3-phosphate acyltransferase [Candidatus Cardinium sp. TP]MCT4697311.1 1-acyl-sn-glycerol-3-phosphate acyltransferase [Candidatus Cardinium sp. TP]MDN5247261.1 1-acyl-sn-glycerol-3-phosphate acyltransferase [Candidatus Cardinium sp.]